MAKSFTSSNPAKVTLITPVFDDSINRYLKEIAAIPSLSAEEEKTTAQNAANGDTKALQKLVAAHLKLVVIIAKKIIHYSKLPLIDLIQEGNLGLMIAAEKFNYKLGYKFATYASWWIKQSMFKAISEQSYCMKIPVYIQETLSKFSKIKSEMEKKYNCAIKNEAVAEKMNIEANKIDSFLNAYTTAFSIEGDFELSDGQKVCLGDVLEDEKSTKIYTVLEDETLKKDLEYVIGKLKQREAAVVKMRWGLNEIGKSTLEEIGKLYGVTKECIRQTELRAIKKLRELIYNEGLLVDYIN